MLRAEVTCVVPARLGSTRFPRKLLQPLFGKPVVVHTLERAVEAGCFFEIICFTDSLEIGEAVAAHGFRFILTGEAANGTDRISRNLDDVETDLIVNLQGDEPAFPAQGLIRLCGELRQHPQWVHTLVHEHAPSVADLENPNRVKAALDDNGFVLDFFRVPTVHANTTQRIHLGLYGYNKNFLRRYVATPVSQHETEMSHELLRDLNIAPLRAHASPEGAPVDTPADLILARERLQKLQANALQGVL